MILKCQEEPFLKEFVATVQSCKATEISMTIKNKTVKKKGYEVILDDTILFPEGGGQPSDEGDIGGIPVIAMERSGSAVKHFTQEPLECGTSYPVKINWAKRFDHMQQHSGQHLLSAILEKEFKMDTTAWWLGESESYVELSTTSVTKDVLREVESRCNNLIRESLPVSVVVCEKDDPSLDKVIKLLGAEPGKKNKTNVRFLVGNRVVDRLQLSLEREQTLTKILNNDASQHADLVEKLQNNVKMLKKGEVALLDELCPLLLKESANNPLIIHKGPPLPSSFLQSLARFISLSPHPPPISLLTHADSQGSGGSLLLLGSQDLIKELSPKICEILKAKGGGTGGRFQAKVTDFSRILECQQMVLNRFDEKSEENLDA